MSGPTKQALDYAVIWHDTAASVYKEFWSASGVSEGDMTKLADVISCETIGGDTVDMTVEEIIEAIREQKCWGFAIGSSRTIHIWADPAADNELILRVIAHECGHLSGEQDELDFFEEQRADDFAEVAVRAYQILMARPK